MQVLKKKKNNFKFIAYGMDTQFLLKSIRETFKKYKIRFILILLIFWKNIF